MTKQQKIRVLHVVNNLKLGGIEKLVYDLVTHVNQDKISIEVCCVREKAGPWLEPILQRNVPVHFLGNYRRHPIHFFLEYRKLLERKKYNVVHSHLNHLSGLFLHHPCRIGTRVRIAHFHSDFTRRNRSFKKGLLLKFFKFITDKTANQIVGISDACLGSIYGKAWRDRKHIIRIYNGIDLDRFFLIPTDRGSVRTALGINPDSLVIGHVGRFRPEKNHTFIIDLAMQLCPLFKSLVFLLIGDGQLLSEIKESVQRKGLQKHFIFTGARTDVPELLSVMDFFILPSLWEGFGLTVVEAQAAGLPVIASDNIPSEIPFISPSRRLPLNDVKGWVDTCRQMLEDDSLKERGERNLSEELQQFSIKKWVDSISSLYSP